jgi:hypothetical protein
MRLFVDSAGQPTVLARVVTISVLGITFIGIVVLCAEIGLDLASWLLGHL